MNSLALAIGIPQYALESSVMQGITTLLDVFDDKELQGGKVDKWMNNYTRLISNIPLPNTIGQVNRVFQDYIMEQKEYKGLDLVAKEKFGGYDAFKRNMWGQKIPVTPTDNIFEKVMYMISPVKQEGWAPDDTSLMIMDLYDKTRDNDILPSTPQDNFTVDNKKVQLNRMQYEEYLELTGAKRLGKLSEVDSKLSEEKKIEKIKDIYRDSQFEAKKEIIGKYFPELKGKIKK